MDVVGNAREVIGKGCRCPIFEIELENLRISAQRNEQTLIFPKNEAIWETQPGEKKSELLALQIETKQTARCFWFEE